MDVDRNVPSVPSPIVFIAAGCPVPATVRRGTGVPTTVKLRYREATVVDVHQPGVPHPDAAVPALIQRAAVADRAVWIGASVVGLIGIKAAIATALCLGFGLPREMAVRAGLLLGQAGEFAFVVIGAAMTLGLIPRPVGQFMLIVAALSMVVTPLLDMIGRRLAERLARDAARDRLAPAPDEVADLADHVVIAGYGRVGQTVAALLEAQMLPYVALDLDAGRLAEWRRRGLPVYYGDARRRHVLERLNIARAAAAVITIDEPAAAGRTLENIRYGWPDLPVYVRARDVLHSEKLAVLGPSHIVPETVESSLQLAGQVLHGMGTPMDTVNQLIEKIRERDYAALYRFT